MTSVAAGDRTAHGLARLDRIDVWAMPRLFIVVIGIGAIFTYYDIFDINVSFVQTCSDIVRGCTAENAVHWLGLPVLLNLTGYAVGAVIFSPLADRFGRRDILLFTMLLTGIGSLYNAMAPDYTNFVIARLITGIGVGADIAIVNVYINEVAPRRYRAKFTTLILVMTSIGASAATWLGLVLTTEAAPWPTGLPFAQAVASGWRWMYGIGALLAVLALMLRIRLPESPRWLLTRGRTDQAEAVIADMERRARRFGELRTPEPIPARPPASARTGYRGLLTPRYLRRILMLTLIWILTYSTVYGFGAGLTSMLTAVHYTAPEAGVIVAIGTFGYIAAELIGYLLVERLERKHWVPIGAVVVIIGAVMIATGGSNLTVAFVGSVAIFVGYNTALGPMYALTAESFPTLVRTGAFGIADGIGHVGGGIGVLLIADNADRLPIGASLALTCAFLVVAAGLVQLTSRTRGRRLEEVSP